MLTPEKLNQTMADRAAAYVAAGYPLLIGRTATTFTFWPGPKTDREFDHTLFLDRSVEPNPAGDFAATPERLTVRFSTANVVILGEDLALLGSLIAQRRVERIAPSRIHATDLGAPLPWIASIAIEEFDQPSAVTAPTNPPSPRNLEP
jgi:hypothetical protein